MKTLASLFIALFLLSTFAEGRSDADTVIPKPQLLIKGKGLFLIDAATHYVLQTPLGNNALSYLQTQLSLNAGYRLRQTQRPAKGTLLFRQNPRFGKEAYLLQVTEGQILLEANSEAGFFYGMMTLMQMMPPAIWGQTEPKTLRREWRVPACTVEDAPRFRWRGMMLDTSRHFFSTTYVKKFIDRMAQHKLNLFHWHLSDDEGWRIEIKKYPLLTDIGSRRGPGTQLPLTLYPAIRGPKESVHEGYYTQKEIKEIVAYAQKRSVQILPEIDVPGHAKAAVMAYPLLLQDPEDESRYTSVQRVQNNTIDAGMESSYRFLEDVIKEVSALFPFEYIHLGGDEIPKGAWQHSPSVIRLMQREGLDNTKEVEAYFFSRMDRILAGYDRKMIVWQEAGQNGAKLRNDTIFMAWRGEKSGIDTAKQGRKVIMSPAQHLYFDQQYVKQKGEPGHTWAGPTDTKEVYAYRPVPKELTPAQVAFIQGVHGCLWSETLLNEKLADYMAWPRMFALAEIAWSTEHRQIWSDFERRVSDAGEARLKAQGISYRHR
jgi:hexosaminidase